MRLIFASYLTTTTTTFGDTTGSLVIVPGNNQRFWSVIVLTGMWFPQALLLTSITSPTTWSLWYVLLFHCQVSSVVCLHPDEWLICIISLLTVLLWGSLFSEYCGISACQLLVAGPQKWALVTVQVFRNERAGESPWFPCWATYL
jgi:hypothetical protein